MLEKSVLIVAGSNYKNISCRINTYKLAKVIDRIWAGKIILLSQFPPNKKLLNIVDEMHCIKNNQQGFGYISSQIKIAKKILNLSGRNNLSIILFAFGQDLRLMPVLTSCILGAQTILRSDGRPSKSLALPFLQKLFFSSLENVIYRIPDLLVTESEYLARTQFSSFHICVGNLYVDDDIFNIDIPFSQRKYDIGFIGRLEKEKGILEFIDMCKIIDKALQIIIIGDGKERDKVKEIAAEPNVNYFGWVDNKELPEYLNQIKIFMLPSYREGVPNTLLEAMSCGCIPLVTPVGGMPDLIRDSETGFIVPTNEPSCLIKKLRDVFKSDMSHISKNVRKSVIKKVNFSQTIVNWENIFLKELNNG